MEQTVETEKPKKVTRKVTKPDSNKAAAKPAPKVKKSPENKSVGTPIGPRPAPEGYTSLAEICAKHKVSPTVARRKLRGSDIEVDSRYWHFKTGSKEERKVIDLLTAE